MTVLTRSSASLAAEVAKAHAARANQIKAQCQAVIFSVADQNTQASLLAALVSGALSEADVLTFRAGQAWIEACKAECRAAIAENRDPTWPDPGPAVRDLADRY